MPCHLCCLRRVDLVRIENWLLCADCGRSETLEQVLVHLRSGDGAAAEFVARRGRIEPSTLNTFYTRPSWETD